MESGGGAFGRCLSHKSGALMNGFSVLIEEDRSGNQQAQWDQHSLSLRHDVCTSSGKAPKLGARVIQWDPRSCPWCLSWEDLMLGSAGAVEWSIYPCPLHGAGALHSSSMGSRGSISRDQSGSCTAFYDLTWEVTQCHLRCFLLVRSK